MDVAKIFLFSCLLLETVFASSDKSSFKNETNFLQLHKSTKERFSSQPDRWRTKRDIADAMRMPGTRWCGRGSSADRFYDLGAYAGADKCCRQHDLGCPSSISPMETKYGLQNWRVYTTMHCTCDERFRNCLKMNNSAAANMIGRIFFNVIRTPCFVLSTSKVCTERTWWGKCLHLETKQQAVWREPLPY